MAEYADREHFIPLRLSDLVELLCTDPNLPANQRDNVRQFCTLVEATYHFQYHQLLKSLKETYAPFDPDADAKPLRPFTPEQKAERLDGLFAEFNRLLERANYQHLTRKDIQAAIEGGASDWGINMDVDFDVFERLEMYARGEAKIRKFRRRALNLFRKEESVVDVYQRMVLIMKLKKHKRLDADIDTGSVFLKVFKGIPKLDLEMMLPGAKVQLTKMDLGLIAYPLAGGIAVLGYKVGEEIVKAFRPESKGILAGLTGAGLGLWAVSAALGGYGYKSYHSYQVKKQDYALRLTKNLYYMNLDNNAGVLTHLIDEAEAQECREAILAYYFLWRHAGQDGWTSEMLDDYVELELERRANLKVDFEIGDAIDKLEKLRIVQKVGKRYRAYPIEKALEMLDWTWDNYFKYNNPEEEQPPIQANVSS
jgi:hypothetical protein